MDCNEIPYLIDKTHEALFEHFYVVSNTHNLLIVLFHSQRLLQKLRRIDNDLFCISHLNVLIISRVICYAMPY